VSEKSGRRRPATRRRHQAVLSVFDGVMIIVGIIIGAASFPFALVAGMTGSVSGCSVRGCSVPRWPHRALCYAELATTFPNAGGDYYF